jgi:plastocyanin
MKTYGVSITTNSFQPSSLEINAGDTVTWTNSDADLTHSIDFAGDSSPELKQGESWSKTFEQPGTYNYMDGLYGMIEGIITVK